MSDRLEALVRKATVFVHTQLGECLPATDVLVARSRVEFADAVVAAELAAVRGGWRPTIRRRLAALSRWIGVWWGARAGLAMTTPAADGKVAIIIQARALADADLPGYLVHELVHVTQLGRPDRRRQHLSALRHLYGLQQLPPGESYAAWIREQVAEGEAYAIQLEYMSMTHPPAATAREET